MAQSLALCKVLAAEGIAIVVATPHQLGRYESCNEPERVREIVHDLNESLRENGLSLEVLAGAEVRLDERICRLLEDDRILTLADGGKFLLLELPYEIFIDIEPLLEELGSMNIQPIISHAERILPLSMRPRTIAKWLEHNTHLQITAASLLAGFGPEVERAAWQFLASGRATLVASDSHDVELRKPQMKAAFRRIRDELGEDIAHLVCVENPSRVVNGQEILFAPNLNQQELMR